MFDELGDRMKLYEKQETGRRFLPYLPVVARLDGKAFHSWTSCLLKPFDEDFIFIMQSVAKKLLKETSAKIVYTQSDEISLVFHSNDYKSQIFFDGKIFKMTSVLASMVTAFFNQELEERQTNALLGGPNHEWAKFLNKPFALFDCRVWQMPTKTEVCNYLIWRENDAVRNSIQAVGQANFSHKELQQKSCNEIQEMLFQEKGINWNDYSPAEKRGSYFQSFKELRPFSSEEIDSLPENHEARTNPNLMVERSLIRFLDMERLTKVSNREEVIFDGVLPK